MLQALFHYFPCLEKLYSILLRTICNPAFRTFVTSEKDDFAELFAEYRTLFCLFCMKFCKLAISRRQATQCLIFEHRILYPARNFAKSSFSDVTKVRNAGLPMVRNQMD